MENKKNKNLERFYNAFIPVIHLFHNLAVEVSRVAELSLAQYRVLMLVYRNEKMSINELKNSLNIAQSSASEMIDRLVHQKHLRKQKDPHDRRITLFTLTPGTEAIIRGQKSRILEVLNKAVEPLDDREQRELLEAFEIIARLMQRIEQERENH